MKEFISGCHCRDCLSYFNCSYVVENHVCTKFAPDTLILEWAQKDFMERWKFNIPIISAYSFSDKNIVIEFQEQYRNRTSFRMVPKDEFITLGFLNHIF